jgi:hypothetical protein
MTPSELARGKASKRTYVLARIAAGTEKAAALGEFAAALAIHRVENKAALGVLSTLANVEVARLTKTKTGWSARLVDTKAAAERAAAKSAATLAALKAKVATMEAAEKAAKAAAALAAKAAALAAKAAAKSAK